MCYAFFKCLLFNVIIPMVAFIITVTFTVYFCISFLVQNNVIDKGEMPKYFMKYVVVFPSEYLNTLIPYIYKNIYM